MIDALPPVSFAGQTWKHGGVVTLGLGQFSLARPVKIDSPFVRIRGAGAVATQLHFAGSGPAIEWTSKPFNPGMGCTMAGGIDDLSIVGYGAAAGSFGLVTRDLVGFSARRASIVGFNKAGSAGWWDDTVDGWNERGDVEMELADNETGWLVTSHRGKAQGYTHGYGALKLWLNCLDGGCGIRSVGAGENWPAQVWNESAHIVVNGSGGTAFHLTNYSHWHLQGMVHCEQNPRGLHTDWSSYLVVDGYSTGLYAQQLGRGLVGSLKQRLKQSYHRVASVGSELY